MYAAVLWLMALSSGSPGDQADWTDLRLTYDEPAAEWTDALPVGNGSVGAMVFGGVREDRIQFNHDTLWVGQPRSYSHPGAAGVDFEAQVRGIVEVGSLEVKGTGIEVRDADECLNAYGRGLVKNPGLLFFNRRSSVTQRTLSIIAFGLSCQAHCSATEPLKVYILAGQSNMEGHAKVSVLDYMGEDPGTAPLLAEMKHADGTYRMIEQGWISSLTGLPEFKGNVFAIPTAPYWDKRLAEIDEKRGQLRQKRYYLEKNQPKHENADGVLSKDESNQILANHATRRRP